METNASEATREAVQHWYDAIFNFDFVKNGPKSPLKPFLPFMQVKLIKNNNLLFEYRVYNPNGIQPKLNITHNPEKNGI